MLTKNDSKKNKYAQRKNLGKNIYFVTFLTRFYFMSRIQTHGTTTLLPKALCCSNKYQDIFITIIITIIDMIVTSKPSLK